MVKIQALAKGPSNRINLPDKPFPLQSLSRMNNISQEKRRGQYQAERGAYMIGGIGEPEVAALGLGMELSVG